MEEAIPREKDLEASYFAPVFSEHGESAQPLLGWKTEYSPFEEGWVDRKARELRWQRRFRYIGHMALLMLILMTIYLIMYTRTFKT
jgi:hypothetical protein